MEVHARVHSVDAVRGIAVLWMVWFQTFDVFGRDLQVSNNGASGLWYTFFDLFNWLPLFMISSGVSLWIMVNRETKKRRTMLQIFFHGVRRYGSYIILSLFLCLWVADLSLFLQLSEVVGAIGFYALISLAILLLFRNSVFLLLISVWTFSFWLREFISNSGYGVPISPFFVGFTIWLTLPFIFGGIFLSERILKRNMRALILFGVSLLPFVLLLTLLGNRSSYFLGTLSFIVNNVLYTVIVFVPAIAFEGSRFTRFIGFFGQHALLFYVSHQAVWLKLAIYLNMLRNFDIFTSALLASLSMLVVALATKPIAKLRDKFQHLGRDRKSGNRLTIRGLFHT